MNKDCKTKNKKNIITEITQSFSAWCLLKGHTYLNKSAAFICRFKYVRPFSGHQALKGLNTISSQTIFFSNLLKIDGYLQIGDFKVTKKQTNDGLVINLLDKKGMKN